MDQSGSIQKSGYKIHGMTCTSCSSNIERMLNKHKGVISAKVNFASEKVDIEFDPAVIRLNDLGEIISDMGYELDLDDETEDKPDEDEQRMMKAARLMKRSVFLSGLIMGLMIIHMFVIPISGYLPVIVVLGFPIIFGTGLHVHTGSLRALKNKSLNMDVLVSLGSLPPYLIGMMGLFM